MTDLGDYAEFKSIIIKNQDRKRIFGEDAIIKTDRKYEDPRKKEVELEVPYFKPQNAESFAHLRSHEPSKEEKPQQTFKEKVVVPDFDFVEIVEDTPQIIETMPKTDRLFNRFESAENPLTEPEFKYVKTPEKPVVETLVKKRFGASCSKTEANL